MTYDQELQDRLRKEAREGRAVEEAMALKDAVGTHSLFCVQVTKESWSTFDEDIMIFAESGAVAESIAKKNAYAIEFDDEEYELTLLTYEAKEDAECHKPHYEYKIIDSNVVDKKSLPEDWEDCEPYFSETASKYWGMTCSEIIDEITKKAKRLMGDPDHPDQIYLDFGISI